jgi:hypothetical protein
MTPTGFMISIALQTSITRRHRSNSCNSDMRCWTNWRSQPAIPAKGFVRFLQLARVIYKSTAAHFIDGRFQKIFMDIAKRIFGGRATSALLGSLVRTPPRIDDPVWRQILMEGGDLAWDLFNAQHAMLCPTADEGGKGTAGLFGERKSGSTGGFGSTSIFGSSNSSGPARHAVASSAGTANLRFAELTQNELDRSRLRYPGIPFQPPDQKFSFHVSIDAGCRLSI